MSFCVHCGTRVADGTARFCTGCGAPVPGDAAAAWRQGGPGQGVTAARQGGDVLSRVPRRRPLWAIAGLVLATAVGVGVYFLVADLLGGDVGDDTGGTAQALFPLAGDAVCGYIDRTGAVIIQGQGYTGGLFSEGLAAALSDNGLYGYLDESGSWAVEPQFEEAGRFSEGLAPVRREKGWAYIDKRGGVVIDLPAECVAAYAFSDGRGLVWYEYQATRPGEPEFDDKYGFVATSGELVIGVGFDWAAPFSEGLAVVEKEGKFGYIDPEGEFVIEPRYEAARSFSDGLGGVQTVWGEPWRYLDRTGAVVVDDVYTFKAGDFSEGLAPICMEVAPPLGGYDSLSSPNQWGFIDKTGTQVIDMRFGDVTPFSQGLAAVRVGDTWSYIDKTGTLAFPGEYSSASSFLPGGLAAVTLGSADGPVAYIDTAGNVVWPK
jgi:hypothetical protein